jgi:nucleoside-diphosphate-sugar epimerase
VEGIVRLLLHPGVAGECPPGSPGDIHQPVNIGNPTELSIAETAALIVQLTGSSSRITYHPLPADDPKCRRPDIGRARALLNWKPCVPLEEGLGRTIEYFRLTPAPPQSGC